MTYSEHYKEDRKSRIDFINQHIGVGNIIDTFIVDRGHVNGKEKHSITDTGIILISNYNTGKVITEIIARPKQIKTLYEMRGEKPPRSLLRMAYKHNEMGYNLK